VHEQVSPTISIRSAIPANVDSVVELLKNAELPYEDVPHLFGDCFAVAVVNNSIVGTAGVERIGDIGLLRSVAVRADLQGKGIGEALTRNRIEWAKLRGLSDLYLLTTTAASYFPRLGFQPVSREDVPNGIATTKEFTLLCPSSAKAMRLSLKTG
jgi:amino-acid N-acetyltransferase